MSTSDGNCNVSASKSSNDDDDVTEKLQNMTTADEVDVSVCANCGKEGSDINNICNKCKQVKYCNAACKKKHRHKHKNDCEEHIKLVAERAAELHDEMLFRQPPPKEDCPICFLVLPSLPTGSAWMPCCGKTICSGCSYAPVYDNQGNKVDEKKCAFCRVLCPTTEDKIKRMMKRIEANDAKAIYGMGCYYSEGRKGFPQDHTKALELWHRAAELGCAQSYNNIGVAYEYGEGVEIDKKKARHYLELAAIEGQASARHNLGALEENAGNMDRALKHHMISARSGYTHSLNEIKEMYSKGHASKDDYMKALQTACT